MKKTTRFRQLLHSDRLEFLLEAHNGLSAKIGEEAGFQGLWASGLSLSAQFGVRDNNEASWTQVLEMLEFMADATAVPILLDGDTGYGNFNNMRRLVHKLEQRDVAARRELQHVRRITREVLPPRIHDDQFLTRLGRLHGT